MTYVIGWKHKNCVFLSSDIAITRKSKLNLENTQSIFGGSLINNDAISVNEECIKLFKINEKVIAGFAGDVSSALDVIQQLKVSLDEEDPMVMIEFITSHLNAHKEGFTIIMGVIDKEHNARLLSYNLNSDDKLLEHEYSVQVGSLNREYKNRSKYICEELFKEVNISEADELAIVNTFHQNLIIQDNLSAEGVGGIFFGLKLNKEGILWQEDTSLLIYEFREGMALNSSNDPKVLFNYTGIINILERDDVIRYSSPFPEKDYGRKVIYNCLDTPRTVADFELKKDIVLGWHKDWFKKTNKIFNENNTSYYGFISRAKELVPKISVFCKESLVERNIRIEAHGNGKFSLLANGGFIKSIRPNKAAKKEHDYDISYSIKLHP